jgi:hypothetical protein
MTHKEREPPDKILAAQTEHGFVIRLPSRELRRPLTDECRNAFLKISGLSGLQLSFVLLIQLVGPTVCGGCV